MLTGPSRHELLKIDGRLLEVSVRLNPRARRMIVKVNPATGEVSVTAPHARGAGRMRWISRAANRTGSRGQLAKAPGRWRWRRAQWCRFAALPHEIRSRRPKAPRRCGAKMA